MHWVVQNNFFSKTYFDALCEHLSQYGIAHSCVDVSPRLLQIKPDVQPQEPFVLVMGSSSLGKIAKQKGWLPGYFDKNLDYRLYLQNYGSNLLNSQALVAPLNQIQVPWERFFIRPVFDRKLFSGSVMSRAEFQDFQSRSADRHKNQSEEDDLVVVAPLQTIYREYRFWVVDSQIATSSQYKLGGQVIYSSQVDEHIAEFAQNQIDKWQPDRAFVLDIADTPEGLKVIEINAINSSALYAGDIGKLINAIECMPF